VSLALDMTAIYSTGIFRMPSDRVTLWQPGVTYNTVPGVGSPGIPNRTTIFTTLSPLGNGNYTAASSFTTASTTITMGVTAPPWIAAGARVYDYTKAAFVGLVSTWVGTTLTLQAAAAVASSGSADQLQVYLDDQPQIQTALNTCPAGEVVLLAAGTFVLKTAAIFNNSNITLRGAGPGTGASGGIHIPPDPAGAGSILVGGGTGTFLVHGDRQNGVLNDPCLAINASSFNESDQTAHTALALDAVRGNFSCTLVSAPTLSVGDLVLIDYVTGSGTAPAYSSDSDVIYTPAFGTPPNPNFGLFSGSFRAINQLMKVSAISGAGRIITFETPFRHTMPVAQGAQLSQYNQGSLITGVGIEELAMLGGGNGNIYATFCTYCWLKHLESYYFYQPDTFRGCYRCEYRDSYLHESPTPIFGGGAYLLSLIWATSDTLVENNIHWNADKLITIQGCGGGNVVAYSYMDDAWLTGFEDEIEAGINNGHYTCSHMDLIEGNCTHKYSGDSHWGGSVDTTVFRNHLTGKRAAALWLNGYVGAGSGLPYSDYGGGGNGRVACDIAAFNFRHNIVGNVLGTQGQTLLGSGSGGESPQTAFAYEAIDVADPPGIDIAIVRAYTIGGFDFTGLPPSGVSGTSWWPHTVDTILRQGNWDWMTGTQTWYTSPVGAKGWPGNGRSQMLPQSLYLTQAPPFFVSNSYNANAWPWVDPYTGRVAKLPAKARFDAGTPNLL
jgi:hypothetical protein